eukprot:TRINITY_DN4198_c0_g1_i2.p1 TRINITY_DN4198_c0_g1~~TRINITY_DN4198_c0_g1_i2.p1  ORF type:complete len:528 (-),score=126.26 TRINITY_DN4198_c0_g1_i2:226-1809(-)
MQKSLSALLFFMLLSFHTQAIPIKNASNRQSIVDNIRYNHIRQKSAHNSYQRIEGVADMAAYWQLRSVEMDLHIDKLLRPGISNDWYVYHTTSDFKSNIDKMSNFLDVCQGIQKALPNHEIITVWMDHKDEGKWGEAGHTPADFDRLVRSKLGNGVFTPNDLINRVPSSLRNDSRRITLKEAVRLSGWPTLRELRGKFMFIWTASDAMLAQYINERYTNGPDSDPIAFGGQSLGSSADLWKNENIVIFNMPYSNRQLGEEVYRSGFISRVYTINTETEWNNVNQYFHHIATDKVNVYRDSWAVTESPNGWPFQPMPGIEIPADASESHVVQHINVISNDVEDYQDNFHFLFNQEQGGVQREYEFYISCQGSHVQDFAKGLLMARSSLDANAAYFAVLRVTGDKRLRIQYRPSRGADTIVKDSVQATPSDSVEERHLMHVKLVISSDLLQATGYGSVDGINWVLLHSASFQEPLSFHGIGASGHKTSNPGVKFLFGSLAAPTNFERAISIGTVSCAASGYGINPSRSC